MSDADLLFKALADPGRRKLLDRLHAHDGQTLGELCRHLEWDLAELWTFERHLKSRDPNWLLVHVDAAEA